MVMRGYAVAKVRQAILRSGTRLEVDGEPVEMFADSVYHSAAEIPRSVFSSSARICQSSYTQLDCSEWASRMRRNRWRKAPTRRTSTGPP